MALIAFHKEIGKIKKDATNPFFKNEYATLSTILGAIKDPLHNAELTFVQFPDGENGLTTRLMHASGEWMEATYTMVPAKNDPQGLGSAISYQRRYSLGAVLGLNIDNDDDGNAASLPDTKPARLPKTAAPKMLSKEDEVYRQLKGKVLGETDLGVLETQKVKLMDALETGKLTITPVQYKDILALIDSKLKRVSLKDTKTGSRHTAELETAEPDLLVE